METTAVRALHFVRCKDCLSTSTIESPEQSATCGACGGPVEYMGKVQGQRYGNVEWLCACDARCTNATGPNCDCSCRGANHGTGRLVPVTRDGGKVSITPHDPDKASARAMEYREAVAAARQRISSHFGSAHRDYVAGVRIARETWHAIREAYEALSKAARLKTHNGRLRALRAICA